MSPHRLLGLPLVALVAIAFGFLLAGQLRTQLIPTSNQLARNEALVRSVQDLNRANAEHRRQLKELRAEILQEERIAAEGSASTQQLSNDAAALRERAGLTSLHGPGVLVKMNRGRALVGAEAKTGYLVNYQDFQDVVNLLFRGGAEAVAVNGRRVSPVSFFRGSGDTTVIDEGPPLQAPYQVQAIGNRGEMESLLAEASSLGDLKNRQRTFQLEFAWEGTPEIQVPAYDGSLRARYVRAV